MEGNPGSTGITSSSLILGCDKLGSTLGPMTRNRSRELLQNAFDLGVRHFDTSSIYGQGDSERYIGETFRERRNEICIATKAGQRLTPLKSILAKFKTPIRFLTKHRRSAKQLVSRQRAAGVNYCFDPKYIESSLMQSLRRLKTNRVDIFYLHSPPIDALSDRKLLDLMERLRREKVIGSIGVSCDDLDLALASAKTPLVEVVQHDMDEGPLCEEVLETAARNGKISLVRGIARGAVQNEGSFERSFIVRYRSALSLPSVRGIIIGTTNVNHLRTNVAAADKANSQSMVTQ